MSKEKEARRKKMGDDPNAQTKSNSTAAGAPPPPQPIPGAPQGKGNMMNNPMNGNSFNPQSGSLSGVNLYPYGDGGLPIQDGRMGGVGFIPNSGQPQNFVNGRGMNGSMPYNAQNQPNAKTQEMLGPMGLAQDAGERIVKLYGEGMPGSYQVGPMGMHPYSSPLEGGMPNPGQVDPTQPSQMFDMAPMQGMPDAQAAAGMSTKRGGGRNKKA